MKKSNGIKIMFYLPSSARKEDWDSVKDREEDYTADGPLRELMSKDFTSDVLFNIGMRHGKEMAEYIARTITEEDIRIVKVWTQYRIENIGHSVVLDALAEDEEGRMISYEMQKWAEPDLEERRRIYEGSLNIAFLAKGERYSSLPRQISIYFLNKDIHGRGKAVYHSRWKDDENYVTDRSMERFEVNMGYEGLDTEEGRMIHDLWCADPEKMVTDVLRRRMEEIKNTKEGRMEFMSDSARLIEKGREEERKRSIETILRDRLATPEQVSKSFNMSLDEVRKIAQNIQ